MIAVDTNVVIRLLTRDDEKQYQKSRLVFSGEKVFIPQTVILETEWVLRFAYSFNPEEIHTALTKLLGLANVHTGNPEIIRQAMQWYLSGLDFADALHLAASQPNAAFLTFDKKLLRKAQDFSGCPVRQP